MLIRIVSVLCVVCARCGSTNKVAELSSFHSSQHSRERGYALRRSVVVCVTACVLASMLVHV